jgi:hypothetical protein
LACAEKVQIIPDDTVGGKVYAYHKELHAKRVLHRRSSGGCDDWQVGHKVLEDGTRREFIASRTAAVKPVWADKLFAPELKKMHKLLKDKQAAAQTKADAAQEAKAEEAQAQEAVDSPRRAASAKAQAAAADAETLLLAEAETQGPAPEESAAFLAAADAPGAEGEAAAMDAEAPQKSTCMRSLQENTYPCHDSAEKTCPCRPASPSLFVQVVTRPASARPLCVTY